MFDAHTARAAEHILGDDWTPTARGFIAGTLVHTRDGPRPIETIAIGDLVLSQPETTGERECKQVTRVVRHESVAIAHAYFWSKSAEKVISQTVITTPIHPFYVSAYHNGGRFSDEYWDEINKPIGWRRADRLESHQLVELANGEMIRFGLFDRIWSTREPGLGWIEVNPDSTTGHGVQVDGARTTVERDRQVDADFAGVDDFNERYETPERQEHWGYKSLIYDLEIERFHSYYVGELGLRVHDAASTR